jgi:hypothetical protein
MEQTAVDFLVKKFHDYGTLYYSDISIAKEIEREQMLDLWEQGMNAMNGHNIRFDDYVKDNYGL